jgi:hypothetical protein
VSTAPGAEMEYDFKFLKFLRISGSWLQKPSSTVQCLSAIMWEVEKELPPVPTQMASTCSEEVNVGKYLG